MMHIQPAPFFASKNRAFWNLQLMGWGGYFLLRAVNAFANGLPYNQLILILVTTISGFSLSLILSVAYRQLIDRQPIVTWGGTAIVLASAVFVHASIDAWVQGLYLAGVRETSFAQRFIGLSVIPLTLLGAWSALYYAINFFLTVEKQADRLQRLEAQATAAQLAMLRYQLNPHFLFNTLNSISTLVLLKQTDPANAMLTRLSKFLRHTLITEPGSQVTVAQEIETLQLYLDIERMRFEERLRTHFEIEDAAMEAMLPSMLLQPLVENAVKYAVSPQEEGARIALTARVIGPRLRITVEDTGPGADGAAQLSLMEQPVSTGVGLANIKNRLFQGYGENHVFETSSQAGGGFTVLIEIPFERAADIVTPEEIAPEQASATAQAPSPPPPTTQPASSAESPVPAEASKGGVMNLNPQRAIGNST